MRPRTRNRRSPLAGLLLTLALLALLPGQAAADPFLGEIRMFAGNFAPAGWALCDGQLLPISQHQALFSLLGTFYGGDGETTFALPDLRGRFPMHPGNGPGLTPRSLGAKGGAETQTLAISQMPSHGHTASGTVKTYNLEGDQSTPEGNHIAKSGDGRPDFFTGASNSTMAADSVQVTVQNNGGGQAHPIMPPYQTINFIIALVGIFPSEN